MGNSNSSKAHKLYYYRNFKSKFMLKIEKKNMIIFVNDYIYCGGHRRP